MISALPVRCAKPTKASASAELHISMFDRAGRGMSGSCASGTGKPKASYHLAMTESEPVGWLETVTLEGSDEPVRVVLEERRGNELILRQLDPGEPLPSRVPIFDGDNLVVMTAISTSAFIRPPKWEQSPTCSFDARRSCSARRNDRVCALPAPRRVGQWGTCTHSSRGQHCLRGRSDCDGAGRYRRT